MQDNLEELNEPLQEAIIQTFGLTKSYSGRKVVDNVNLTVFKGDIFGLIGRNGAGKTTLIKMLLSVATPDEGRIVLCGKESPGELEAIRAQIGALIDQASYISYLSALDNMKATAKQLGLNDEEKLRQGLKFVGLNPDDKLPAKKFSLGMKQRLAIATAMLSSPQMLILDEPVNGLDPMGIYEMRELFKSMNEQYGVTILISSHLLGELGKIANSIGVMENGKLVSVLRKEDLSALARPFIKVVVGDMRRAINVITDNYKSQEFEILPFNTIAIYNIEHGVAATASLFSEAGVPVVSIAQQDGDLESAFVRMMGGYKEGGAQ